MPNDLFREMEEEREVFESASLAERRWAEARDEVAALRRENEALRERVAELEAHLIGPRWMTVDSAAAALDLGRRLLEEGHAVRIVECGCGDEECFLWRVARWAAPGGNHVS
jgi:hypothetical protein